MTPEVGPLGAVSELSFEDCSYTWRPYLVVPLPNDVLFFLFHFGWLLLLCLGVH